MKLIAHRGASLLRPENSLESLQHAADLGADAVECDVRLTCDNVPVIFHDPDLLRLTGWPVRVADTSERDMRKALEQAGRSLLTLPELLASYTGPADLLLHLKVSPPPALLKHLKTSADRIICGVSDLASLDTLRACMPSGQILAFVDHWDAIEAFAARGAGIVRLWENWLTVITPDQVREATHKPVWIMANRNGSMDGSPESLALFRSLHADGVLLNDIAMALHWKKQQLA